jgi:hypothetical protein
MNDYLNLSRGSSEYFYSSGNTFGRTFSNTQNYKKSFSTYNNMALFGNLNIEFMLNHSDEETTGESATAKFSSEQAYDILGEDWKDSISSVSTGESFSNYGITRQMGQSLANPITQNYILGQVSFFTSQTQAIIFMPMLISTMPSGKGLTTGTIGMTISKAGNQWTGATNIIKTITIAM